MKERRRCGMSKETLNEPKLNKPQTPKGVFPKGIYSENSAPQSPFRGLGQTGELKPKEYFAGRGAQLNPSNRFLKTSYVQEHWEGIDEDSLMENKRTQYIEVFPKTI